MMKVEHTFIIVVAVVVVEIIAKGNAEFTWLAQYLLSCLLVGKFVNL